jgi:hypothetical protein
MFCISCRFLIIKHCLLIMKTFILHKIIWIYLILSSCKIESIKSSKCDRTPEGTSTKKSPSNGSFKLRIWNDPIRYQPGLTYNSNRKVLITDNQTLIEIFKISQSHLRGSRVSGNQIIRQSLQDFIS